MTRRVLAAVALAAAAPLAVATAPADATAELCDHVNCTIDDTCLPHCLTDQIDCIRTTDFTICP